MNIASKINAGILLTDILAIWLIALKFIPATSFWNTWFGFYMIPNEQIAHLILVLCLAFIVLGLFIEGKHE